MIFGRKASIRRRKASVARAKALTTGIARPRASGKRSKRFAARTKAQAGSKKAQAGRKGSGVGRGGASSVRAKVAVGRSRASAARAKEAAKRSATRSSETAKGESRFDLSGGVLCLDFANTVGNRPEATKDLLKSYADLLAWSDEAGTLEQKECRKLGRRASRNPAEAQNAFKGAIEVRETLYRIYSALAAGRKPGRADLASLNDDLSHALPFASLVASGERYQWSWSGESLDRPLWPVIRSAADLLTSDETWLVRECGSATCSWLFIDRSRTRCRRWCDMKTCGNRQKARRYYQRHKGDKSRSR